MAKLKSYTINCDDIDDFVVNKITKECKNKQIGLDMKNVKSVSSVCFINCLLSNKFKLYNLNSEVLAYLSMVLKDGRLKSYINFEDLTANRREFTRRRFKLV